VGWETCSSLGKPGIGLEVGGLDEAEGQQPRRLAVVAVAVGFDPAAVGGLTAAVLLDLTLELLERWASHPVHLLPLGGGWRWGARPSSVRGPGSRPPTGPLAGARWGGRSRLGTTAQPGQGAERSGCSPGLVLVRALVLAGVGELEGAGRA
jgi:hypothetical protein